MATSFIIGFANSKKISPAMNQSSKLAIGLILAGIILTELLLFIQGTMFWNVMGFMPYYYELLFGVSVLLPAGIFWYGVGVMGKNEKDQ